MKICIKNGTVIDPSQGIREKMDVLIADGKIEKLAEQIEAADAEVVDAAGKIVCPGFIDMHVHLREPGFEYKEDIASGTKAAAAGGFTTVCCMPNTNPVIDEAAVAEFINKQAKKSGLSRVHPIGAISKGENGQEMAEMAALRKAGCVAFSDDGKPVASAGLMRNAMDYAKMFGMPLLAHSEEKSLSEGGQMHEGYYSTILGLQGIPSAAEEVMVARDIRLAELTGAHLHVCHISSKGTVELIREARKKGIHVTCEVTPNHLLLTDAELVNYDTNYKVNPPLPAEEDRQALIAGLLDGTIDCIATDHAPHHKESKECEFNQAAFGISGLETAVAFLLDGLVKPGILPLETMIERLTADPARVLKLESGSLKPGAAADLTLLDLKAVKTVSVADFYSKGKNSPLDGKELTGWPWMTIVNGEILAIDGKIVKER